MVINDNNTQINTFTGGMNTDMSYDNVQPSQYVYAENIRITKAGQDVQVNDANVVDGIVTPVMIEEIFPNTDLPQNHDQDDIYNASIIGSAMLDNVGAIIIRYTDYEDTADENTQYYWMIFKVTKTPDEINVEKFYRSTSTIPAEVTSVSVVINKETDGVLKLYIADGQDSVFSINLNDNPVYNDGQQDRQIEEKYYRTGKVVLIKPAIIQEKVQGRLKTSQVQYVYRYYRKYGNASKLSPITRKIQVIDTNRNKETGNAEDTETSVGFSLKIPSLGDNHLYDPYYDRMQVFRIQYIKVGNPAEVHLIYDDVIQDTIIDDGIKSLQKYSLDEFGGLEGLLYTPQSIEQNQNYLFASNVKDTTIRSLEGEYVNATGYACVAKIFDNHRIDSSTNYLPENSFIYDIRYGANGYVIEDQSTKTVKDYFDSCSIQSGESEKSYINAYNDYRFSSFLRSLRRGETYKYGVIIYYDDGSRSEVKPLANSIYIPDLNVVPVIKGECTWSVGVSININYEPTNNKIPIYFQVVRQEITRNNQNTVLQCILSRPVYQKMPDGSDSPLYPTGYITTQPLVYDGDSVPYSANGDGNEQRTGDYNNIMDHGGTRHLWELDYNENGFGFAAGKYINEDVFQIFSPEINVFREDTLSELTASSIELQPVKLLYHNSSGKDILNASAVTMGDIIQNDVTYPSGTSVTITEQYDSDRDDYIYTYTITGTNITVPENRVSVTYTTNTTEKQDDYKGQTIYSEYSNNHAIGTNNNQMFADLRNTNTNPSVGDPANGGYYIGSTVYSVNKSHGYNRYFLRSNNYYLPIKYIISNFKQNYEKEITRDHDSAGTSADLNETECLWNKQEPGTDVRYFMMETVYQEFSENNRALTVPIESVKDVKNPTWNEGYTNIQLDGKKITGGNKAYKSFATSVGNKNYLNWVCSSEYDLQIYESSQQYRRQTNSKIFSDSSNKNRFLSLGWQGPGPICMLIKLNYSGIENKQLREITRNPNANNEQHENLYMCTYLCNITHATKTVDETQAVYYGFGNFGELEFRPSQDHPNMYTGSIDVFDGDIYPTMAELHGMYQTYNFNSIYRIPSAQTVYYAPMESRVNPFFDYGMNYRNTQNDHMMIEPGAITGVMSQERPVFQYNPIYSDNGTSADIYTISSDLDINEFPNRIVYSQLKTPGEKIDNWSVFKPLDYIDTDSRYGQINHMQSWRDSLFFWQTNGFGRIIVNERSLVSDQNNNQIQLGTGGVLQRADYLSTMYGMREYDRASCQNDYGLFWIDVNNKAILKYGATRQQGSAVENYGEARSVQNIINQKINGLKENERVDIYYDKYNSELLCKLLNKNILTFNLKYNVATSIYTKQEDTVLNFNEFQADANIEDANIRLHKINNILVDPIDQNFDYLSPTKLSFLINKNAQITKVFDNQKITSPIMDKSWSDNFFFHIDEETEEEVIDKQMSFTTDIVKKRIKNPDGYTDREGNLLYNIPREKDEEYGYRIRGRWMQVDLEDKNPNRLFAISHVITKFRQSFS